MPRSRRHEASARHSKLRIRIISTPLDKRSATKTPTKPKGVFELFRLGGGLNATSSPASPAYSDRDAPSIVLEASTQ
jgi:hypothetical protein